MSSHSYLTNLADVVFCPKSDRSCFGAGLFLPSLSASLLLQHFIPIITFPPYFTPLYDFVHRLAQLSRGTPLALRDVTEFALQQQELLLQRAAKSGTDSSESLNHLVSYVSENLDQILHAVGSRGFPLLFLHIFPLFQHPETCFEAVYSLLDPLAAYVSRRNVERLFSPPVLRLFDASIEPYQRGQLLSRSMADVLLRWFGLKAFLRRFIGFIVEAVFEPVRAPSKSSSRKISTLFRLKSASTLTLVQSDLFQSGRFEDVRKNSDLTYSYTLSDALRGYDSDKEECSSVDSDEPDYQVPPETSLLAKSGLVLGAVNEAEGALPSLPEEDEEAAQSLAVGHRVEQGMTSDRDQQGMLYPDSSLDLSSSTTPHILSSGSTTWPRQDDSGRYQAGQTDHERLHASITAMSSLKIDTTSTEYRPSTDSPNLMTQSATSSLLSEASHDPISPSSSIPTPYGTLNRQSSLALGRPIELSVDNILGGVGEDSEDEQTFDNESLLSTDPEVITINRHISQVAADCICWLIRRIGPLLTTRHIARPLLDNLHRCFTGILDLRGREVIALDCLKAIAKYYGEMVVTKLYIPYAETLVSTPTCGYSHMHTKSPPSIFLLPP